MKRIRAACICQTLHFFQKDNVEHKYAAQAVQNEVMNYKKQLERNHVQYQILSEVLQPDGSILLRIIKQYNNAPVGDYLK
jgi:hypothetical protein